MAAEGILGPDTTGAAMRPSASYRASASAAAAAIALARSILNCLRSARRFSLISSDVSSAREKKRFRAG